MRIKPFIILDHQSFIERATRYPRFLKSAGFVQALRFLHAVRLMYLTGHVEKEFDSDLGSIGSKDMGPMSIGLAMQRSVRAEGTIEVLKRSNVLIVQAVVNLYLTNGKEASYTIDGEFFHKCGSLFTMGVKQSRDWV